MRPAPAAMSAATMAATPRTGRSRRLGDGYDIFDVLQGGARGMVLTTSRGLLVDRGVAPLWPVVGTMRGDRGRRPRLLVWEGVREAAPQFLLSQHFLDGFRPPSSSFGAVPTSAEPVLTPNFQPAGGAFVT